MIASSRLPQIRDLSTPPLIVIVNWSVYHTVLYCTLNPVQSIGAFVGNYLSSSHNLAMFLIGKTFELRSSLLDLTIWNLNITLNQGRSRIYLVWSFSLKCLSVAIWLVSHLAIKYHCHNRIHLQVISWSLALSFGWSELFQVLPLHTLQHNGQQRDPVWLWECTSSFLDIFITSRWQQVSNSYSELVQLRNNSYYICIYHRSPSAVG